MCAGPIGEPLEGEPSWRFAMVAGVHYPSRGFFADLISSKWMQSNLQGKSLGDTFNCITVPFREDVRTMPADALVQQATASAKL